MSKNTGFHRIIRKSLSSNAEFTKHGLEAIHTSPFTILGINIPCAPCLATSEVGKIYLFSYSAQSGHTISGLEESQTYIMFVPMTRKPQDSKVTMVQSDNRASLDIPQDNRIIIDESGDKITLGTPRWLLGNDYALSQYTVLNGYINEAPKLEIIVRGGGEMHAHYPRINGVLTPDILVRKPCRKSIHNHGDYIQLEDDGDISQLTDPRDDSSDSSNYYSSDEESSEESGGSYRIEKYDPDEIPYLASERSYQQYNDIELTGREHLKYAEC